MMITNLNVIDIRDCKKGGNMNKYKVTCEDIKKMIKVLKKYKVKEPYFVKLNIIDGAVPLSDITNVYPTLSPFYRDSVGGEEMRE